MEAPVERLAVLGEIVLVKLMKVVEFALAAVRFCHFTLPWDDQL
jgi:hypothetical protein